MIDVEALLRAIDLVDLVEKNGVVLKQDGKELKGKCPFHDERTPSFYVAPEKGFVHCFGCGAHYNAIGFVMRIYGETFLQACKRLGHADFTSAHGDRARNAPNPRNIAGGLWIPIAPVPDDAPRLAAGVKSPIWNPKRARTWNILPERADEYRNLDGQLLGYVVRVIFGDGSKITPQITWCIGPDGSMRWCVVPFPKLRPLCGLDALAIKPSAPVLIVEGEKCRAVAAEALPMYAAIAWPGGSKGLKHVDWAPLHGRDIVLWPDADQPGREAMLGFERATGTINRGIAQYAVRAKCKSIRMVDPDGQPKGWDIADAVADGWTPRQIATWAAMRVVDVDVLIDDTRQAA